MDYNVTLAVPKATPATAPAEVVVELAPGLIVEVRVGFPDGCADYVHAVILRGIHQVWPTNPDGNYSWNDYTYVFQESYVVDDEPLELRVLGWNDDTRNLHTVTLGFNMLPLEPTVLSRFVQAVLGRPTRWR
uniref:Uncharacterized protein n=1 Tax=viral metagenome TaxID=1070528 RepID=A0A6H1ZYQ6_9ZZZZ